MQKFPEHLIQRMSPEEQAFCAKLIALNTAFEAARAGKPAQPFGQRAASIDELLDRYFLALKSDFPSK